MKVLLDTPVFLWAMLSPRELSEEARELLVDPGCEKYLSVASVWEITVKQGTGKLVLATTASEFVTRGLSSSGIIGLPITMDDTFVLAQLPLHHEDIFDRQLIAQAKRHGMFLMTADPLFELYDVQIIST